MTDSRRATFFAALALAITLGFQNCEAPSPGSGEAKEVATQSSEPITDMNADSSGRTASGDQAGAPAAPGLALGPAPGSGNANVIPPPPLPILPFLPPAPLSRVRVDFTGNPPPGLTLVRAFVKVNGPGMATPIIVNWNPGTPFMDYLQVDVPRGQDRRIEAQAELKNGIGQTHVFHGSVTATLTGSQMTITVFLTQQP